MGADVTFEGGYNIRELGSYALTTPHITRSGVLLRSGNLDKLSPQGQQQLITYGVQTIVDLRDEWEAENYPNPLATSALVTSLNLPLIGNRLSHDAAWKTETQQYAALHDLYAIYLERCRPQIGAIVAAIARSTFPTLFYCHAGKDRTGIVTALLLAALDVPDATIAQDYARSTAHITHLVEQWRVYAIEHGRDLQQLERDSAANPETMLALLAHLRERYMSPANYLSNCGVSTSDLDQLRAKFIV